MGERANEIDAALAMIDTARWARSSTKLRVLLVVKLNTVSNPDERDGVPLGVRYFAEAMGLSYRSIARALAELVDERVLAVREDAAGRRGAVYRIQPEVRVWRVPWAVPVELVEFKLARLSGRLIEPKPAFARATGRAQPLIARAPSRAEDPGCARDGARATPTVVSTPGRAQPLAANGADTTSLLLRERSFDRDDLQHVCSAIALKCREPVTGPFAERVALALDGADTAPIIEAVRDARAGLRLPALVTLVEQLAAGQHQPAPAAPRPRWVADPDCSSCSGSGWADAITGGVRPCDCRQRPENVVPECDDVSTTPAGGAP